MSEPKKFKKKISGNYDKMLWGHIDWDMMLQDTIDILSQIDISTDLGHLFEETLIDDVSYAVIKYDELDPGCPVVWIFPEEREETRKKAIERVHLRCGYKLFKQIFKENFSGKTLDKFDKCFAEFVKDYLKKKSLIRTHWDCRHIICAKISVALKHSGTHRKKYNMPVRKKKKQN